MTVRRNTLLRKRVLERDQGICKICGRYDPKWQHDHETPLWQGGADTLENSQTLCRRHHLDKTIGESPLRAKADRLQARHALTQQRRSIEKKSDSRTSTEVIRS